ncbi:MAG: aminotransferase class V-fold PLP-dependent enzyme [Sulfuricellaceae bacterium]|nr:aminotransferase class V-fold PLP-dependent enzyme [Sulfuricellaceae bacterium]
MNVEATTVYLDNNATTAVAPECAAAMMACLESNYANPSSKHPLGMAAKQAVGEARGKVARFLKAGQAEIVFTGGASESNHTAIMAALALNPGKRHIVTSRVEHPSVLLLLQHLETRGVRVTYLPVDGNGRLSLDDFERSLGEDTALASLMWANNETGVLFPVAEAAEIAKAKGVLFHTDAVQAAGRVEIDLERVPADLLSFSGHKLHAPKGIGALFVRKGIKLPPLFFGHQERGRRGGTENVPAIAALGAACELAVAGLAERNARIAALRDKLEAGVLASMPGAQINGAGAERLSNTSSIRCGETDSEIVLDRLSKVGICASAGSACTAGGTDPSHVLIAMGLGRSGALATIRFSLSRYSREDDVDRVVEVLSGINWTAAAQAA